MGSIPLPALDIKQQQQPDLLDRFAQLSQIKAQQAQQAIQQQEAPVRQQILNQQAKLGQIDLQKQQQALQDQQTLSSLSPNFVIKDAKNGKVTGYNYDGLFNAAAQSGVSPQTISTFQKSVSEAALAKANLTKAQLDNQATLNTQAFNHLEGLRGTQDPAQRQQLWNSALQWTQQNAGALGVDLSKLPQQAPDDNTLNGIEASIGMHAQQIADASKMAETHKNQAQGDEAAAVANSSLLKQYAPSLSQSANQQDYTKKLQAFETLHPDLAGRFPQQFDPKNPQAILNAGMTASELADYQQKERLAKYTQGQENYRAQLGRQTTYENARMLHGLNQIDQYTADPQHGYGQFVSQAGAVKSAIQSAKDGNQLAASLEPMMLALGVSSFAGVHRINDTEINQAGPAVGSVMQGKSKNAQNNEKTTDKQEMR